jgi:uncharacterized protein
MEIVTRSGVGNIARRGPGSPAALADLAGQAAWIISDGRAGHLATTLGIGEALGVRAEVLPVAPSWPFRLLAPWGPADRRFIAGLLSRPWPAIALGAGRQTVPVIRALKRQAAGRIFTVLCQDPKTAPASADLIWVPQHDRLRGENVIATLTPPHRFSAERLAALRSDPHPEIAARPAPHIAVFVGGPGGGYDWTADDIARFAAGLKTVAAGGGSLLITPSRRTPPALLAAVDEATAGTPRWLWRGEGENPYAAFLAHADAFIVTADSVNMAGEASATGRPIHVFHPHGGRPKFHSYHAALEQHGATRRLTDASRADEAWRYPPLDAAGEVAAEIARRWRLSPAASCAQQG